MNSAFICLWWFLNFTLFRPGQLVPCGPFQLTHAFGFVPFQQLCHHIAMQTALAEMFALVVPVLFVQESV